MIMDYEKKYKEALERARNYYSTTDSVADAELIELIFPELNESEDEKIRKEIILAFKFANVKGVYNKHLAWLEKQSEQKWSEEDEMMCTIAINACEYANDEFESFNDNYEKAIMWLKSLKKRRKE